MVFSGRSNTKNHFQAIKGIVCTELPEEMKEMLELRHEMTKQMM